MNANYLFVKHEMHYFSKKNKSNMPNKLDLLLREKTDPIYETMVEKLENKGWNFEKNPYYVLTFHAQIGALYKKGGIAFYGRATNGWDDDYNDGINSILTHSHSRFFQMIKRIANSVYQENQVDNIVWSNICKVAPEQGNPDDVLWEDQYNYIVKILNAEMEVLRPSITVLITGIEENKRWDSPLFKVFEKLEFVKCYQNEKLGIECSVEIYYNQQSKQYFLITGRPDSFDVTREFMDFQANHIIDFIKSKLG